MGRGEGGEKNTERISVSFSLMLKLSPDDNKGFHPSGVISSGSNSAASHGENMALQIGVSGST